MRLLEIHGKDAQNQRTSVDSAILSKAPDASDASSARSQRQLSLLRGELLPSLRGLGGLCTGKFDADLITEGVDYAQLLPGTRLGIGNALIEITAQGKRCFDECPIRQRGERCPLPKSCVFGRVIVGGRIKVGDLITPEKTAD